MGGDFATNDWWGFLLGFMTGSQELQDLPNQKLMQKEKSLRKKEPDFLLENYIRVQ